MARVGVLEGLTKLLIWSLNSMQGTFLREEKKEERRDDIWLTDEDVDDISIESRWIILSRRVVAQALRETCCGGARRVNRSRREKTRTSRGTGEEDSHHAGTRIVIVTGAGSGSRTRTRAGAMGKSIQACRWIRRATTIQRIKLNLGISPGRRGKSITVFLSTVVLIELRQRLGQDEEWEYVLWEIKLTPFNPQANCNG